MINDVGGDTTQDESSQIVHNKVYLCTVGYFNIMTYNN